MRGWHVWVRRDVWARAAEESKRATLFLPASGSGVLAFILAEGRGRESKTPFLRVYGVSCSKIYVCSCLTAWIAPFDVHRSFLPTGAPGLTYPSLPGRGRVPKTASPPPFRSDVK